MRTHKAIKVDGGFAIERKDKKTGNRINLLNTDKKLIVLDSEQAVKDYCRVRNLIFRT